MTALRKQHMSVDEFITWAVQQPDRWELVDGLPVAMSPERVIHGDVKYHVARALDGAIAKAGLQCRFVLDSAAVRVDARTLFQPDALVYRGEPVAPEALEVPNPVIVIEVLSPSNATTDLRDKLQGYFRVPSVHHYLVVDPDKHLVIHHARGEDAIATRIFTDGSIRLEPLGLELPFSELFPS
jgi:Uma2 family endonuclease